MMNSVLVKTENISKCFKVRKSWMSKPKVIHAVDHVSIEIAERETLGVVGESGCGKSTLGKLILSLTEPTYGKVFFENQDIHRYNNRELFMFRKKAQIIFQDPFASLNPRKTIGQILSEGPKIHKQFKRAMDTREHVERLLEIVGLDARYASRFPHEFSGGQRQRIAIARALSVNPKFIVADEPVSALDVSVQAQIVNLMVDLQDKMGLTYLFISHDLRVIEYLSVRVIVMYLGKIMEVLPTENLFKNAVHPYTKALISAIPSYDVQAKSNRIVLNGDIPSAVSPPSGCVFHTRCPIAEKRCKIETPMLRTLSSNHSAACLLI